LGRGKQFGLGKWAGGSKKGTECGDGEKKKKRGERASKKLQKKKKHEKQPGQGV